MPPFHWTPAMVAALAHADYAIAPVFALDDAPRVTPDLDLWDHWPALTADGALADIEGGLLVIGLTAPIFDDPDERHRHARLRLLRWAGGAWRDLGPLLPDHWSPGSREWAGSATWDTDDRRLTLYFTAAGERGEAVTSFSQRLFACATTLDADLRPVGWTPPRELVVPDGKLYQADLAGGGAVGTIKAFRDPYFVRNAADGGDMILFAASRANADSGWNGLVGRAVAAGTTWRLAEPVVDATGVNNELERPHLISHGGHDYLFWSTQRHVFAPGLRHAPTGLYGIVRGWTERAWRPINGHCLVFANPDAAPAQAYSWQVLPDLSVWSFADIVGLDHAPTSIAEARRHFAGAPAPRLRVRLEGDRAWLTG